MDARISNADLGLPDVVWGAAEIGVVIGRSRKQTHHLLKAGHIKSARKVGNQWCASVKALRAEFDL
jgi:hypothetical protein